MLSSFPKQISNKAIAIYLVSLTIVSVVFMNYAMSFKFMLMGFIFVFGFFFFSNKLSVSWKNFSSKVFVKKLFGTALMLRVVWVVFSYYFYIAETGIPFEWTSRDALGAHDLAVWLISESWSIIYDFFFIDRVGVSDVGYPLYVTLFYRFIGPSVIGLRLVKALLSSLTCVMVYKFASRGFGESTGRMAGLFCMLMPNLIIYCGMHLKETEMIFLTVAFVERADYLLRDRRFNLFNIVLVALFALSLFFFRTVLGGVAVASFFTGLVLTSERIIKTGKKVLLVIVGLFFAAVIAGGTITIEIEQYWNDRGTNQEKKRMEQTMRGNQWAQYATGVVMAPMIIVLPFATMVDVSEQYTQQLLHGGNFVKNFMGIFVLFAFVYLVFVNKKWRDYTLIGSFTIGYLLVIAMSAFANAERFLLPAVPFLLAFAAYGVSQLSIKNVKYVNIWCFVIVMMELCWAFFKLGSRGLASF